MIESCLRVQVSQSFAYEFSGSYATMVQYGMCYPLVEINVMSQLHSYLSTLTGSLGINKN
jgi:hypothetical protein